MLAQGKRNRRAHRSALRQQLQRGWQLQSRGAADRRHRRRRRRRPLARHGVRSAGHSAGQSDARARPRKPRFGRAYRALRKSTQSSLPDRRHSARSRVAAAPVEGRGHFAAQNSRPAQYRRAPLATGRPHQDPSCAAKMSILRIATVPTLYGESVVIRLARARADFHRARDYGISAGAARAVSTR